jgi:hypothetical protein
MIVTRQTWRMLESRIPRMSIPFQDAYGFPCRTLAWSLPPRFHLSPVACPLFPAPCSSGFGLQTPGSALHE